MKILCICLSTTIQRTLLFKNLEKDSVNRADSYIENASGKALNTARILNQLENKTADVLCPVGKYNSKKFLKLAKKDSLKIHPIFIPGSNRSCWTLLSSNGSTTEIVCDEPVLQLQSKVISKIEKKLLTKLERILDNYDAVVLSGSTPKFFSNELCAKICKTVTNHGIKLLVDFRGIQLLNTLLITKPDFIKINESEFRETFFQGKETSDLQSLMKEFFYKYESNIIVTRGVKSTLMVSKNFEIDSPIEKCTPINTTACGDSFNAGFIYNYLRFNDYSTSLAYGNHIARLNAESIIPGSIKPF